MNFPLRSWQSRVKYNLFTDQILTVSSSIKQTLVRGGVNSSIVEVIYEGLDLEWIDGRQAEPFVKSDSGSAIATVAHLSPEKGLGDLLEAIEILKRESTRVHLYLVGDGHLKATLVEKAKRLGINEVVTFCGFRSDAEALMKQFDIFCLPSLSEGLSSAIMAAMASQLPVVATTVGGIPELVADGETGLLVPAGDPVSLAKALRRLLENPGLRLRMGRAGRERIEKSFTVERKIAATEKSYRKLLAKSRIR